MKKKIFEALKTEYASLGLSDNTLNRIAAILEGSVEKEEDIVTAVKGDTAKLLATSIQGEIDGLKRAKETAESALADYKAKHPEGNPPEGEGKQEETQKVDIAKMVADSVSAAVQPLKDAFELYKTQNSAKEAKTVAKTAFFENQWTSRFTEEANDAWERVEELNSAKGETMTQDELVAKATEYFNRAVSRKGADATKPFESEENSSGTFDFSGQAKYLEGEGLIPKENK